MILVAVWFERYEIYIHADNKGFGLTDPPHEYHIFMQELLEDNKTGRFHFDWLLSAVAFCFWLRLLFMLILTDVFGPLITITVCMMKDLMIFFVLFVIELIAFACVGILSFGNLKEYTDLNTTLVMFFESSLGNWDFSIYEDESMSLGKKWYGILFHMTVLLVNMLLLLNLVIAIMSDTYSAFATVKLGLFSQGIIEAIPSYKNDKHYGFLISAFPPFNLLTMLCLPFMLCIKNRKKKDAFNMTICKICYLPVMFFTSLAFIIMNLLLVPFAYGKSLAHKYRLYKNHNSAAYYRNKFLCYIFTGIPMLIIA